MKEPLNIVLTGEVDSGKSTLIGRFLYEIGALSQGVIEETGDACQRLERNFEFAYLLDSLEEERKNQLTLDMTQFFCKSKRGREFVFIDVPGHQELLKNMLCGSSYADIAILVIDVQKSVEQQTKRHTLILKFLGIEQIIIVLNKMDLVRFNEIIFNKVKEEISQFFKSIQLQPKCFIPISAKEGENLLKVSKRMTWYKGLSLNKALNTCFKKENNGPFRFPVQDVYNINKEKIAVGEIISGKIKKGEKVNILPFDNECKVKAIKIFNKNMPSAYAPENIGLILDEMDEVSRGGVICKPRLPKVTIDISAKIFCVHSMNIRQNLLFRCSTQETPSRISQVMGVWDSASFDPKSKEDVLDKNDFAEVIINTERPVVIERVKEVNNLGRFILQNNKEICAVGIII